MVTPLGLSIGAGDSTVTSTPYPDDGDVDGATAHLIMDTYAGPQGPDGTCPGWPPTPGSTSTSLLTHASWMNLVECWLTLAERQAIHRGAYTSGKDLNAKIRAFVDGWNDCAHPFTWTKTAGQVLTTAPLLVVTSIMGMWTSTERLDGTGKVLPWEQTAGSDSL